ncbi:outer membrane beta-barrel protein [Shinella daejeonensis]|uniref:outer membrane beta-barrel protein n=1 Tax=Shinella daejeonensis TaxID=659017 RepID=UPI0020C7FD27|nr:outer membrane beta-barrel protein [Shinella daejeonensis]MCP8894251.1 outer membrane beta-barrel protein [Shinella daejeonensis]
MAEAGKINGGAASPRLKGPLAGLLLAGIVLACPPAHGQEQQNAFSAPLATGTASFAEPGPALDETDDGQAPLPAPLDGEDAPPDDPALVDEDASARILPDSLRENLPQTRIDSAVRRAAADSGEAPGVPLGAFTLRPSLSQGIGTERTSDGGGSSSRTFSRTGFRGVLTSDWSRHQLTVDADGVYERNLGGTGETQPEFRLGADLRLDLSHDTIANITGGYRFNRESSTDPNAVSGASAQSGVQTLTGGARVTRDFGLIRGTAGLDLERQIYGSAKLSDGSRLSLADRNRTEATLTGRIGYELSPALIPYLEASAGRSFYDRRADSLGYERSATLLGGRGGVEIDLGEKLRGDLGIGYKQAHFEDHRLSAIETLALDGSLAWSPQRGTDLRLGFRTEIEPSTAGGESGYVAYETNAELTHQLRDNLVATLMGAYTLRDMPSASGSDQNVYRVGAGLAWDLNRWLAMTGDVSYEVTTQSGAADSRITRAGIGLVLRR